MTPDAAIVFVLSQYVFADTPWYVQYCVDRGYRPLGVIKGDFSVALEMLHAQKVQVIVFASRERQILDGPPTRRPPRCIKASVRPSGDIRRPPPPDRALTSQVDAYRDGYADGFVDSVTLRAPGRN